MENITNQLETLLKEVRNIEFVQKKENLEKEMELLKVKRGNESLQEVIKIKDDLIADLKEAVKFFQPGKKNEEKK